MAKIQVSQPISIHDEQSLYSETSMFYTEVSTTETEKRIEPNVLHFSEPEIELKHPVTPESVTVANENNQSISPALPQTQASQKSVSLSQYKKSGVRRCGRLSEF